MKKTDSHLNDCLRLSTTKINGQTPERLSSFVNYENKYGQTPERLSSFVNYEINGQPPERLSSFVNYENKRTDT